MKYVEWVDRVLRTAVQANLETPSGFLVGADQILERIAVPAGEASREQALLAAWHAIEDLEHIGLLDAQNVHLVRITQESRKLRHGGSLEDVWPQIIHIFLEPEQEQFLRSTVELAEVRNDHWADVDFVEAEAVMRRIGWPDDISVRYGMAAALEGQGLARQRSAMGGYVTLRPTYAGVVRATERDRAAWYERIKALVAEGETANVEFKRELQLGSERQRAEFVRDVLALANTNVSGPKYLLVGFDPKTLGFHASAAADVTQDRVEDVLNAWAVPAPSVKLDRVDVPGGEVLVIQVTGPKNLAPYLPKKQFGKILEQGQVFVRHGSHVEAPTTLEAEDLDPASATGTPRSARL